MDLWIRSQDKRILQKVNKLYVCKYPNADNKYAIYDLPYPDGEDIELGLYKTKERALEVLDEIQELLMRRIHERHINKFDIYNGDNHKVYEMLEE